VIAEIDWNVGRLLDTLVALDLDSNTLVIYTSDNGPWLDIGTGSGSADPLRGGKFGNWEGSYREPTIMRWPGTIPANTVNDEMAALIDLFPTFAGLTGGWSPQTQVIDGMDIISMMTDPGTPSPHDAFYYDLQAIRMGNWKLKDGSLYDVVTDVHEDNNVAGANSGVVSQLQSALSNYVDDINANKRPMGTMSTEVLPIGCTSQSAVNYDATAVLDDGSCNIIMDCMDILATNYNATAVLHCVDCCNYESAINMGREISSVYLEYQNSVFSVSIKSDGVYRLSIYNINGKEILNKKIEGPDIYRFSGFEKSGLYLVSIKSATQSVSRKITSSRVPSVMDLNFQAALLT
jgi:hypothetical protein